jgi:hypothetical protein
MAGNISSGDFGCCGRWTECASNKGCVYHDLIYAMEHCNVFQKMFVEQDAAFTKSWTTPTNRPARQIAQVVPEKENALAAAMALLKKYGG